MPSFLPISAATLFLQPDGTYSSSSTGAAGESAITVPITDLVCMDDLDPNGSETTSDLQNLTQDIYHVILETLGANLDDPTRGIGIENVLSASSLDVTALPPIVDRQIELDARVQSSTTTLTQDSGAPNSWTILIEVLPVGSVLPIQYSYSSTGRLRVLPS